MRARPGSHAVKYFSANAAAKILDGAGSGGDRSGGHLLLVGLIDGDHGDLERGAAGKGAEGSPDHAEPIL